MSKTKTTFAMIAISSLTLSEQIARKVYQEESVISLAEHLLGAESMPPLLVRKTRGGYEVVDGGRRLQAALLAGYEEVPCEVRTSQDDAATIVASVVRNLSREDLNMVEVGIAAHRLQEEFGLNRTEIAQKFGCSEANLGHGMNAASKLSGEALQLALTGAVTFGTIVECLVAEDPCALVVRAHKEKLSLRKVREIRQGKEPAKPAAKPSTEQASAPSEKALDTELEQALKLILGASAVVDCGKGVVQAHNVNRTRILELAKMISKPSVASATLGAMA